MLIVYECDSGKARYSINCMACRFTAQSWRNLAEDDTSQNQHGSGIVVSDDVFEQMNAKYFRKCNSSLRVRSGNRKTMHGRYRRLTEQSPVDRNETHVLYRDVSPTSSMCSEFEGLETLWQAVVL